MVWRPVVGWEGLYEACATGKVRTCRRPGTRIIRNKLLKPAVNRRGHLRVVLKAKGRRTKYAYVHLLIAEAFLGKAPSGMLVLHRDDDKRNNRLGNLYHGTRRDNAQDAIRNGCHGTEAHRRKKRRPERHVVPRAVQGSKARP